MKFDTIMSMNLVPMKEYAIVNAKGEAAIINDETMFRIDWKTLTARPAPLNFGIAKTSRALFAEAVKGEFFARELTSIEAEAAKLAEVDDDFFTEAAEDHSADEIAEAKAKAAEAKKRINTARDFIAPLAKDAQSVTVKAIVSALRAEAMPAKLAKPADDIRAEAKTLCESVARTFSEAEVSEARAICDNKDNHGLANVTEAEKTLALYALSEGETQGIPNVKRLRDLTSKFIKALWQACPAEGVQKSNLTCNHALSVEVFQRARNSRKVTKKGNVKSSFASTDEIAREVVFAVIEVMQAKARAEAAEAEAKRKAEAAEAKPAKK